MKRFLCTFLVIAMLVSVMPVISMAEETTANYEDYVPGEMPENMFKTDAEVKTPGTLGYSQYGFLANIAATGNWVARDGYTSDGVSGKYLKMTAQGTEGSLMSGSSQTWYFNAYGLYFGQAVIKSNNYKTGTSDLLSGDIAGGKNYVYNIQVKNLNQDYIPSVVIGLFDLDSNASQYSKEYGSDGMAVEGAEWVDFKGTIANKSDGTKNQTVNDVDRLSIGLHKGTTYAKSSVAINLIDDDNGMHRAYLAEEVAYDIENNLVSGNDTVEVGDELTFEAILTNQIGLPGCLDQTFEWLAMDTDRQNEVSGISIVPSDDTTTATITIEDTLTPGSYDIVAYSEAYDMAKGYTITLEAPYYYADNGDISIEAKLNSDEEWTTESVTTGLVNYIEIKATLEDNEEAFEWIVTDKNRLSLVEDVFTLTPVTTEGEEQILKVTATTGVDIKPGDYNIVAVAKDGSVKAQPVTLDITKDLDIILATFAEGTTEQIEEGLNTTYLSVLGLLDSNSSKADKAELANVIYGAAQADMFDDVTEVEDIREVLETLAALSFYNVTPEDMELVDENGDFAYSDVLGIDDIDTNGVTLYSLYKNAVDTQGKANIISSVIGKEFVIPAELTDALKESILLNAIQYPTVNGTGFVADILTEENLEATNVDSGNYLDSDMKSSYHTKIAGEKLTIEELEEELAKEYEKETTSGGSGGSGGGGGGSSGKKNPSTFSESIGVPANQPKQEEDVAVSFADVSEEHWAYKEIVFLAKAGIISGSGDGNYNPSKVVTREEALKMICQAFNIESQGTESNFADVKKDAWYYSYVTSANAAGIVNGISATEFGIGKSVSRQDICVMIMRAAGATEQVYPDTEFADKDSIPQYAKNAVNYLSALFIVNGFNDSTFRPANSCTRAEIAKIIYNCVHILGDNIR